MPISIIFMMPLSISPLNSVWGLTRLSTTTWSASEACLSRKTGSPSLDRPISTAAMLDRIGHPIASSVTP